MRQLSAFSCNRIALHNLFLYAQIFRSDTITYILTLLSGTRQCPSSIDVVGCSFSRIWLFGHSTGRLRSRADGALFDRKTCLGEGLPEQNDSIGTNAKSIAAMTI